MANLLMHRNVLKHFHVLPRKIQKGVGTLIDDFQRDHTDPRLYIHDLKQSMRDPKVRGAKLPDGYRAILIAPEQGDNWLLVHVDSHDRAYDWAAKKLFEVHGQTGAFQIIDLAEVQRLEETAPQHPVEVRTHPVARLSDDDLFILGVPRPLIPAVRSISTEEEFNAVIEWLPADCREVLTGIALGLTVDEALEEFCAAVDPAKPDPVPASSGDFSYLANTQSREFIVVEGEEALKAALDASLEEWRLFLHPYQRKLVDWDRENPISITGAAGTGKTVCLMHRAVRLARQMSDKQERILVTTFTRNLSVTIAHQIESLDQAVAERIEVTNLHKLASSICWSQGWRGHIASDEEMADIWKTVMGDPMLSDLPMPPDEIRSEFDLIIDPMGIDDEETYLTCIRSGRPRITRQGRKTLWPIFVSVRRQLTKRKLNTFDGCIHEARLVAEKGNFRPFAHVLVDEIQDFSLEALRLIKTLSPIGTGRMNPLTTAGDGHQRIYRGRIPLSRAGIDIQGRSRRLKINYRTTEQIRNWAQGILHGIEIDDLDLGVVSTKGDQSVRKGPDPNVVHCSTEDDETQAIATWIQGLLTSTEQPLASHEICVTYPTGRQPPLLITALTEATIPVLRLERDRRDPGKDEEGIRLGTMKRIKGLEFKAVVMACANPTDPMNDLPNADLRDRCERYVAATRARDLLLITLGKGKRAD